MTEVRLSPVHGRGLFARADLPEGETILRWGGTVMAESDLEAGKARPGTAAPLGNGLYLADPVDSPEPEDYPLNHSCDPNLWMGDEITLILSRPVRADEELAADYALWEINPRWVIEPCLCGSPLCRLRITGDDWRLGSLQERYGNHFTPYINNLIRRMHQGG